MSTKPPLIPLSFSRLLRYVPSLALPLALGLLPNAKLGAQGGIVWTGVDKLPSAVVVQVAANSYEVYCPGFMTVSSSGKKDAPADDVGTGIGIQPGTVRKVDGSEFDDQSDGQPTDAAKLFPFASNLKTRAGYLADPRGMGLVWSGFHARATAVVPGYHRGALRFRFNNVLSHASLIKALTGAVVAVSHNSSTGVPYKNSRLQMLKIGQIFSPQILYYKFMRAGGDMAVNFANPYAGAASQGLMKASSGSAWAPGRYGSGLRGGTSTGSIRSSCDTFWKGDLHGSVTLGWWMKQRSKPGKGISTFFRGPGPFSCYTGGAAGKSLRCVGYAPGAAALQFTIDIQKLAATSWIHLTLRLDAATKRATLYVMGKAVQTLTIGGTGGVHLSATLTSPGSLSIGAPTGANIYDLDEFRLFGYAVSPRAIGFWPSRPLASATAHAGHGDVLLTQKSSAPWRGNSGFELAVLGPKSTVLGISLGIAQNPPFLVFGSLWYNLPITILLGATNTAGLYRQPLPIPTSLSLRGQALHNQAFMLTKALKILISNAEVISIE